MMKKSSCILVKQELFFVLMFISDNDRYRIRGFHRCAHLRRVRHDDAHIAHGGYIPNALR